MQYWLTERYTADIQQRNIIFDKIDWIVDELHDVSNNWYKSEKWYAV